MADARRKIAPDPIGRLLRRLRSDQRGFTLIELLVAATLAAVGIISLVTVFDTSRNLVTTAEREEAAAHQAQREIEKILALDYNQVALKTPPTPSTDPKDPNYYVGTGSPALYQWDQGPTGPKSEPLHVDALNGQLDPPTGYNDGQARISGQVHRFVTWVDDPCCAGTQNHKRVTVAVTVDGSGGPKKPVLISSIVIDPAGGG